MTEVTHPPSAIQYMDAIQDDETLHNSDTCVAMSIGWAHFRADLEPGEPITISIATIAKRTRQHPTTARLTLKMLVLKGWLERHEAHTDSGRRLAPEWRLTIPKTTVPPESEPENEPETTDLRTKNGDSKVKGRLRTPYFGDERC